MKLSGYIVAIMLAMSSYVMGATVHLQVVTDKATYFPGQTVHWTIQAWASSGDNQGVALLSVHLNDNTNEILLPPLNAATEFTDTEYGTSENFTIVGFGTQAATAPRLRDITVLQFPASRLLNVGNDNTPHVYCKGSYVVTNLGNHSLTPVLNAANYWPDGVGNAVAFEANTITSAAFDVVPEPLFCGDANTVYLDADIAMPQDCYVNFLDFAVFASEWLNVGCTGPSWCQGADIDEDTAVDDFDLELFVEDWLACTDPANAACDIFWK